MLLRFRTALLLLAYALCVGRASAQPGDTPAADAPSDPSEGSPASPPPEAAPEPRQTPDVPESTREDEAETSTSEEEKGEGAPDTPPDGSTPAAGESSAAASAAPDDAHPPGEDGDEGSPPAPTGAPPPARNDTLLDFVRTSAQSDATCVPRDVLLHGKLGYVACGTAGVWVFGHDDTQGWQRREVVRVAGSAVGLWLQDGQLQVDVVQTTPAPLALLRSEPEAAGPHDCTAAARAELQRSRGLRLRYATDAAHCMQRRDHVKLLSPSGEKLGTARVIRSGSRSTTLALRFHARVDPTEVARLEVTEQRGVGERVFPQRGAPFLRARLATRGLLGSGPTGGMIGELELEYIFRRLAFIRAELSPFALAGGSTDDSFARVTGLDAPVGAVAAVLYAGVDTRGFALGTGVGMSTVNEPLGDQFAGTGTTLPVFLRLGARDGLFLALRGDTTFLRGEPQFTLIDGRVGFPLVHHVALRLRGRGGPMGVSSAELAVRWLVHGNGGPGSTFLETSLGGGAVFRRLCVDTGFGPCFEDSLTTHSGTTLGVGAEWRR